MNARGVSSHIRTAQSSISEYGTYEEICSSSTKLIEVKIYVKTTQYCHIYVISIQIISLKNGWKIKQNVLNKTLNKILFAHYHLTLATTYVIYYVILSNVAIKQNE
jgi:hypothetical protein